MNIKSIPTELMLTILAVICIGGIITLAIMRIPVPDILTFLATSTVSALAGIALPTFKSNSTS